MLNDDDLTPAELVAVELPTALRGYRTEDVDALIDRVADALEARDALLASMTEDRDALVEELQRARTERDRARTGVAEAEAAARAAVEDARRLRERVQGRAESLLADAARRADELRAQGRRDAAELVATAEVEARAVLAEAEQRREAHTAEMERVWHEASQRVDEARRTGERARARIREELERQLAAVDRWEDDAAAAAEEEAEAVARLDEAVAQGLPVVPDPPEPEIVADPEAEAREAAAALAAFAGIDADELAELDAPWDLGGTPATSAHDGSTSFDTDEAPTDDDHGAASGVHDGDEGRTTG